MWPAMALRLAPVGGQRQGPLDGELGPGWYRRVPTVGQVPVRSVAAYFFQGRSIMIGKSSRSGAGTCFIM
jgi:hypothetical protein